MNDNTPTQEELYDFVIAAGHEDRKTDVEAFLDKYPAAIDAQSTNTTTGTALISAAVSAQEEMLKYLLQRGADINAKNHHGFTALMNASISYSWIVELLLDQGARVDEKDNEGKTAIEHAREHDQPEIADILERRLVLERQQLARQRIQQEARELAKELADFSPALKGDVRAPRPFSFSRPVMKP